MGLRFAIFLSIMLALAVSGHVYIYRRLIRDVTHSRTWRRVGIAVLAVLGAVFIAGRFVQRFHPSGLGEVLSGISFVWMGLSMFLVFALMAFGVARRTGELFQRRRTANGNGASVRLSQAVASELPAAADAGLSSGDVPPPAAVDPARRLFLARAVASGATLAAASVSTYGAYRAYTAPEISEVPVKLPKLPRELDGFTIVQLTDIHVGNLVERRFMDELVRRANALKPDLVAITGDLVDGSVPELGHAVAALQNLNGRYGAHFITGNHEYYSGDRAWTDYLSSIGVNVLRNRHVTIGEGAASFDLVGVDDWSQRDTPRGYDLTKALAGRNPDRAAVLLAHQPTNFPEAAKQGIGLQLSGHTHGGQLVPMTFLVSLMWQYSAGLYREQDAHIYVSRGCGFWGPPMRVGSPPELVKIVLTS